MTALPHDNSSTAILVIEDSRVQAMRLKMVLEQNGYHVHWADTGQTGLAAAQTRPFDLIVLDVELPDKSGFDICRDFKADPALADVPIIMLTKRDHAKDETRDRDRELLVNRHDLVVRRVLGSGSLGAFLGDIRA